MTRIVVFLAVAVPLAACGSDYCASAQTYEQNALGRQGSCQGTVVSTNFSHTACENALSSCSSADQSQLNAAVDCLNSLPSCSPATQGSFIGSEVDCVKKAPNVSLGCIGALVAAGVPVLASGFNFSACGSSSTACKKGSDCCSGTCLGDAGVCQ